jgi:hypothetical protein
VPLSMFHAAICVGEAAGRSLGGPMALSSGSEKPGRCGRAAIQCEGRAARVDDAPPRQAPTARVTRMSNNEMLAGDELEPVAGPQ